MKNAFRICQFWVISIFCERTQKLRPVDAEQVLYFEQLQLQLPTQECSYVFRLFLLLFCKKWSETKKLWVILCKILSASMGDHTHTPPPHTHTYTHVCVCMCVHVLTFLTVPVKLNTKLFWKRKKILGVHTIIQLKGQWNSARNTYSLGILSKGKYHFIQVTWSLLI